ncbi:MAG: trypsin-like serine protease [Deltaproteobacteria bacterium]|nr:trypsin-like serine protease [Deltaproteobacteria bacterium]MBW2534439.1 trypsin-like serine protease [Deltaproteobacteria bacterium]
MASGGIGGCTGSLIAPNLVLTAQHCVAPTSDGGAVICGQTSFFDPYPANQIMATTATTMPFDPLGYKQGAELVLPPSDSAFCGNDMALVILAEPIDGAVAVPLVPRVDVALESSEIYSAVGYGQTYDSPSAPSGTRYRRDGLSVYCVGEACGHFSVDAKEWAGETGICQGDSGGPALDAYGRVVGVASRGGPNCSTPIYGHVPSWGQWIMETAVYAAGLMGAQPPAWATGWPTDPAYSQPVGAACGAPEQCPSQICHEGVCSRLCNDAAPCPAGFGCSVELGICERRLLLAPDDSIDNGEPTGCTVAPAGGADDPTQPIPWAIVAGLAALARLRRRRG